MPLRVHYGASLLPLLPTKMRSKKAAIRTPHTSPAPSAEGGMYNLSCKPPGRGRDGGGTGLAIPPPATASSGLEQRRWPLAGAGCTDNTEGEKWEGKVA